MTNGLHVSVHGTDCTAHGVTSGRKYVTLIGDGIAGVFEPGDDAPAIFLEYDLEPKGAAAGQLSVATPEWLAKVANGKGTRSPYECLESDWASRHRIVRVVGRPVDADGNPRRGGMFGGHYISTSDSRFPVTSPIPVHDRFER